MTAIIGPDGPATPDGAIVVDTDELLVIEGDERRYVLTLFVSGASTRSARAVADAQAICERHVKGRYDLVILDLNTHHDAVRHHRVIVSPTLIKHLPPPEQRYIGDLSHGSRVLVALDLPDLPAGPESEG